MFWYETILCSVQQIGRLGSSAGILTTNHQTRTASNKQTTNRFAVHSDQLVRVRFYNVFSNYFNNHATLPTKIVKTGFISEAAVQNSSTNIDKIPYYFLSSF